MLEGKRSHVRVPQNPGQGSFLGYAATAGGFHVYAKHGRARVRVDWNLSWKDYRSIDSCACVAPSLSPPTLVPSDHSPLTPVFFCLFLHILESLVSFTRFHILLAGESTRLLLFSLVVSGITHTLFFTVLPSSRSFIVFFFFPLVCHSHPCLALFFVAKRWLLSLSSRLSASGACFLASGGWVSLDAHKQVLRSLFCGVSYAHAR